MLKFRRYVGSQEAMIWIYIKNFGKMNINSKIIDGYLIKGMRIGQLEDNSEKVFLNIFYSFDILIIINYLKIYK